MQRRITNALRAAAVLGAVSLLAAGCSSGGTDGGGGGDAAGGDVPLTYMAEDGSCAEGPAEGIDFAAADEVVKSFETPNEAILATEPLKEPVDPNTTAVYLNNGTPVAGLFQAGLQAASEAAGIKFVNVDTGTDAQSINSALNSVVEMKPDIVFDQSVDARFFQDQLTQLQDQGTAIVYGGQLNAEEFGLRDSLGGAGSIEVNSDVLANAAVQLTCGTATEFVMYSIPEIPASEIQNEAVPAALAELCPECTLRIVDISIADASPADKIVSDLQANPQTEFFISLADQFQIGLSEKAQLAGLTNAYGVGQSSLPQNIQQIADGTEVAGYVVDFNMFMWLQVDEGLRTMQGMEVPYLDGDWEAAAKAISHIVTIRNADEYLTPAGYVALEGFEDQFLELWGK
ncbi:substrate-binding domain-containing protein [Herbiconiux sp.]|uniref:substrate-binding domain-containing protein n=1 Tax=Herbiconiux sp. TaxID=1871186 RepID=UPI0025BDFEB6|nr:substrate-binding domain-containing protein [Herbiconiux sp.]